MEIVNTVLTYPILKGIAKRNGDGFKDSTKIGDVVFVINQELPEPHERGQYRRLGNKTWTASRDMFDFTPASLQESREKTVALPTPR